MLHRRWLHRLSVDSVVVYRARAWGGMLCAVPALRALRAALPTARITLVGRPGMAQFARRFRGYVDGYLPLPGPPQAAAAPSSHAELDSFCAELASRRFALALQLHGSGDVSNRIVAGFGARAMAGHSRFTSVRTATTLLAPYPDSGAEPQRLLHLLKQLGAPARDCQLEFPLLPDDIRELAESPLATRPAPGSYLCLYPGGGASQRGWPAAHFASVADQLAREFDLCTVLAGQADDAPATGTVARLMRTRVFDMTGQLSVGALAALLHGARLLICNDTLASCMAAGLGLHSVAVFRDADIARWAPCDRLRHRCIWDPDGERANIVLGHARALLSGKPAQRQQADGIWPYW